MANLALPVLTQTGLARYLKEINRFPMLSREEEYMDATAWRQHEDIDAAHRLVTSHLRLAAKIAMRFRGYGLPVTDLIQEANIGLMEAVKRFDPEKGFRLSTYAMWWIRAAVTEYVLHSWSLVKIGTTAAQKKLFFGLRRMKNELQLIDSGDLAPEQVQEIARRMDVPEREVVSMNRRLAGADQSLNAPVGDVADGSEWLDWVESDEEDIEEAVAESEELAQRRALLGRAMAELNDRERRIFTERRLRERPRTLESLSDEFGVSRERIRQIEVRAFQKVQASMREAVARNEQVPMALKALPPAGQVIDAG